MWLRLHPAQQRGRGLSCQSLLVFASRELLMLLFFLSHLQPVNKQIHTSTNAFFLQAVKHHALKWPPQTRSLAALAAASRPLRPALVVAVKTGWNKTQTVFFFFLFAAELKVSTLVYELGWFHESCSIKAGCRKRASFLKSLDCCVWFSSYKPLDIYHRGTEEAGS